MAKAKSTTEPATKPKPNRVKDFELDLKEIIEAIPKSKRISVFGQLSRTEVQFKEQFALLVKLRERLGVSGDDADIVFVSQIDELIKD